MRERAGSSTIIPFKVFNLLASCCRDQGKEETEAIYPVPDDGSGKRVSQLLVHNEAKTLGDLLQVTTNGETSQGLVPEQAYEAQEGELKRCKIRMRQM